MGRGKKATAKEVEETSGELCDIVHMVNCAHSEARWGPGLAELHRQQKGEVDPYPWIHFDCGVSAGRPNLA